LHCTVFAAQLDLLAMSTISRLQSATERLRASRAFTQAFLTDLTPADWYWSPPQYTTHIAWQVGHIAVSQYNLCFRRIRGRTAADESLITEAFFDVFKIGSAPSADISAMPPLEEIKRVFDGVYEQSLVELAGYDDEQLDVPLDQPHPRFKTKLAAIEFAPLHELVHAGQIAMLRRLMGKPPLR
jgi:hypothetical protein